MTDAIMVINAGSSSIKFALVATGRVAPAATGGAGARLAGGQIDRIGGEPCYRPAGEAGGPTPAGAGRTHASLLGWLVGRVRADHPGVRIVAGGHRVVHGGREFAGPAEVTAEVLEKLRALSPLAPSHQPHNIAGIEALRAALPEAAQVACLDTAFHRTQPRVAQIFALPRALTEEGILRYGFHGLSYEHIASVLPGHLGPRAEGRIVVAHLGHGASMCAMRERRSVATSMGLTALDGLVMGTRCGEIDPGVLLHLLRDRAMSVAEAEDVLTRKSGLLGVSGLSDDMRDLLASDAAEAREAVDLFVYRAARQIGSLAAALGGLDAIVFTGGIGEHSPEIRGRILGACGWLGVRPDEARNARGGPRISAEDSTVDALAIPTDEEGVIARQTAATIAGRF